MGLLDMFLGQGDPAAPSAMVPTPAPDDGRSLFQRYLLPDDMSRGASNGLNSALGAIGAGLLAGNSRQWINPQAFSASLEQSGKDADRMQQRAALKMILKQANPSLSDAELEIMANDPATAKLAMSAAETQAGARAGAQASGIMGGLFGGGAPSATPPAPGGPAAGASLNGSDAPTGEIQNKFVDALKGGGLTNPYGLGAVAAYAQHESRYDPKNISGSWSDPSESGQAGTSGGILSWRADRLDKMRAATQGAQDPVVAQAQFTLNENPELTAALQSAKSPEEANRLMADAWKFAGYDRRDGGEFAARLATTQSFANRFAGAGGQPRVQTADASGQVPVMPLTQAPLPAPPRRMPPGVQVANNEQQVQDLESRMGQQPPPSYGITRDTQRGTFPTQVAEASQADVPLPDAQEAAFEIPPGQGSRTYGPETTTARALAARQARAGAPVASQAQAPIAPSFPLNDPAQATKAIPKLYQVLAIPNLPEGQRTQAKSMLDYALGVVKPTDRTRQLIEAGFTPGTPEYREAYKNLINSDRTPSGYRFAGDGQTLEAIPGGPQDPSNRGAKAPPPGYRAIDGGERFEPIPGGPADPTTISMQAQARAAGKPAAAPKPLPQNAVKDLSAAGESYGDFNRLVTGFRPDFAGWKINALGDAANAIASKTGIGNTAAADWWADYAAKRNVTRNKLFGSALTASEKSEFLKADITPGMTPEAIGKNLQRQQTAATNAARKLGGYYLKAGRNPEEIEAALGIGLDDLGIGDGTSSSQGGERPDSRGAPRAAPNTPPAFSSSDLEAEARRRGLLR